MFFCGFGRVCFLKKFTRSTMAVPLTGFTRSTFPCLPRSLPLRTTTVSPFRMWVVCRGRSVGLFCLAYIDESLDDFRRERDDLHELPLAELAGHGTEDARPDRLAGILDENRRIVVDFDVRAVAATRLLDRAHNDPLADDGPLD